MLRSATFALVETAVGTVEAFYAGVADDDGATACEQIAPEELGSWTFGVERATYDLTDGQVDGTTCEGSIADAPDDAREAPTRSSSPRPKSRPGAR